MKINKELTMFRCEMNRIHLDTSLQTLDQQAHILDVCLAPTITFQTVKHELNKALEMQDYEGFTSELDNLLRKDEKLRGHDYLQLWMKTFFMFKYGANFIIADTASHNMLQNVLNYEQKNQLLHMMRGKKYEQRGHVQVN